MSEGRTIRFGPFELDLRCGELRKDGVRLKLQGQPIEILELLLSKHGELVSREEIRQRLWSDDTFVDFEHSLNTAVKKLRQALGDEAVEPRYIETLPKRGYRFVAEIETPATEFAPQEFVAGVLQGLGPEQGNISAQHRITLRFHIWTSVAALVLLLVSATVATRYFVSIPMPRVVASHRLTNSGYPKSGLVSDGTTLYFQETRPSGRVGMQMSVTGGEPTELRGFPDGVFMGISRTRSELLVWVMNPDSSQDAWAQPLPAGPARLILKNALGPTWTADGRGLLFARNDAKELYYSNADGTDVRRLATLPDIRGVAVSPDGMRIRIASSGASPAFRYNLQLWEANADGSNLHVVGEDLFFAGQWSPDGNFYFSRLSDGEKPNLWVTEDEKRWWSRTLRKPKQLTFGPLHITSPPVFRSDGKKLFVVGSEPRGELSVYDAKSKNWAPYLSGISASYADFSPDGQWIAYVSYPEGSLWRSRVDGSQRMQLTSPPIGVLNPRWSPDGRLIAFTDLSGADRQKISESSRIYVVSADGGGPLLLVDGQPGAGDPAWSPDGSAIAYHVGLPGSGAEIRIINLKTQRWETLPGAKGLWSPRWSPDGKYIVALKGFSPFTLVLFDVANRRRTELLSGAFLGWPSWSRDSKAIYFFNNWRIWRINVENHNKQFITEMSGFPNAYVGNFSWFGLTPDGRLLRTRNTANDEIYAFDLEYK